MVAKVLPDGRPGLETIVYQYPLKLITPTRPSEDKSVLVFLLSYGGGLVAGDCVSLAIEVQSRARLSMVTQGYTKVFKSPTSDVVTSQSLQVRIATDAALCLLPDPVQPFEGSSYKQTQIFKLAPGASLCLLDWVTQGRAARGEDWSFRRWAGRSEVWATSDEPGGRERLLVRDLLRLDGDQSHMQAKSLRDIMQGQAIFGTLILRGPLTDALGDFFLAEFDALPRIGARDWNADGAEAGAAGLSPLETWRAARIKTEARDKVLWSAARVRACVVVKFGAADVEAGRVWIGTMLAWDGTVAEVFGQQALMCVR